MSGLNDAFNSTICSLKVKVKGEKFEGDGHREYNWVIKNPPKMSFIRMIHKLSKPFFNEVSWWGSSIFLVTAGHNWPSLQGTTTWFPRRSWLAENDASAASCPSASTPTGNLRSLITHRLRLNYRLVPTHHPKRTVVARRDVPGSVGWPARVRRAEFSSWKTSNWGRTRVIRWEMNWNGRLMMVINDRCTTSGNLCPWRTSSWPWIR